MNPDFDIIIVGSGPAGVSAAFPLVEAGLRVLMVDGGQRAQQLPPTEDFLSWRANNKSQAKWMVGDDFYALKMQGAVSPKLRVPHLAYVFDQFERENQIVSENFIAVGSLAIGGLSNAWGCGVARFSRSEFNAFPFPESDMEISYAAVAKRIGISGGISDDLSDYFGLDQWSQPPITLDKLHSFLLKRYNHSKSKLISMGFKIGRSRVAALSEDRDGRKACSLTGNCLWGCHGRSLYASVDELPALLKHENFHLQSGLLVKKLSRKNNIWFAEGRSVVNGECKSISATNVLLAAGTLATTRLVLQTLQHYDEVPLLSCPNAAFLLWVPRLLGIPKMSGFGLGQLSFTIALDDAVSAFGSTFATTGIGVAEFLRRVPLRRRYGADLFRYLLSSCVVGNVFLPGDLTRARARLRRDHSLEVSGEYSDSVAPLMNGAAKKLRRCFLKIGAFLVPKSFTIGRVGADIHYSGTHPMRQNPAHGETSLFGEVMSLNGLYVVDGACLPTLPAKSHTFMIMANADRIGRKIASMGNRNST